MNEPNPTDARPLQTTRASGSCAQFDYDDNGQLWRQWQKVDGRVNRQGKTKALRHARGGGQNRHWIKSLVYDEQYSYDGLDQVVGTNRANEELDWIYDEIGNWLRFENSETGTQDRTHNDLNQITGITETPPPDWITPVYDGDGPTTLSPRADDPAAGYHHKYDAWGRIVETWVPRPDYPAEKRRILRHCYDARGHRVRTQVHDPANGKLRYTDYFMYDEQWRAVVVVRRDPIPDSDGELSDPYIQRQFLWTPTTEYPDTLVRQDTRTTPGSGQFQERQYALQDDHANAIASVDAGGSVSRRWTYEPFGKANWLDANFNAAPPEPEAWPILFSGYRMEENTGLYQVRHWIYDPGLGRWLIRDPIGERGGLNLYGFVWNDPLNLSDRLGLEETKCCNGKPLEDGKKCCRTTDFGEMQYTPGKQLCCKDDLVWATQHYCCHPHTGNRTEKLPFWSVYEFGSPEKCIEAVLEEIPNVINPKKPPPQNPPPVDKPKIIRGLIIEIIINLGSRYTRKAIANQLCSQKTCPIK